MTERLDVLKTYKLFIGGKFPRTESGRTMKYDRDGFTAHMCRASRKDLRNSVEAAHKALGKWAGATAYLRGQILYRMAEMMEGKRAEFENAIGEGTKAQRHNGTKEEVTAAIDRLVAFAGWADKYAQVLGCNNAVTGPYYNFTVPQPTGVVAVVAPDDTPLLGLISLIAPALCAGNTIVALGSETNPVPTAILGEVCATSGVPGGVVNLLTGYRDELIPFIAAHREIDAIQAAGVSEAHREQLRAGAAENLKRVRVLDDADFFDDDACEDPWRIEPTVEMKTIWHPSAT